MPLNPILLELAVVKAAEDGPGPPPNYHPAIGAVARCASCKNFISTGMCKKFKTQVDGNYVCDMFEPKDMSLPAAPGISPGAGTMDPSMAPVAAGAGTELKMATTKQAGPNNMGTGSIMPPPPPKPAQMPGAAPGAAPLATQQGVEAPPAKPLVGAQPGDQSVNPGPPPEGPQTMGTTTTPPQAVPQPPQPQQAPPPQPGAFQPSPLVALYGGHPALQTYAQFVPPDPNAPVAKQARDHAQHAHRTFLSGLLLASERAKEAESVTQVLEAPKRRSLRKSAKAGLNELCRAAEKIAIANVAAMGSGPAGMGAASTGTNAGIKPKFTYGQPPKPVVPPPASKPPVPAKVTATPKAASVARRGGEGAGTNLGAGCGAGEARGRGHHTGTGAEGTGAGQVGGMLGGTPTKSAIAPTAQHPSAHNRGQASTNEDYAMCTPNLLDAGQTMEQMLTAKQAGVSYSAESTIEALARAAVSRLKQAATSQWGDAQARAGAGNYLDNLQATGQEMHPAMNPNHGAAAWSMGRDGYTRGGTPQAEQQATPMPAQTTPLKDQPFETAVRPEAVNIKDQQPAPVASAVPPQTASIKEQPALGGQTRGRMDFRPPTGTYNTYESSVAKIRSGAQPSMGQPHTYGVSAAAPAAAPVPMAPAPKAPAPKAPAAPVAAASKPALGGGSMHNFGAPKMASVLDPLVQRVAELTLNKQADGFWDSVKYWLANPSSRTEMDAQRDPTENLPAPTAPGEGKAPGQLNEHGGGQPFNFDEHKAQPLPMSLSETWDKTKGLASSGWEAAKQWGSNAMAHAAQQPPTEPAGPPDLMGPHEPAQVNPQNPMAQGIQQRRMMTDRNYRRWVAKDPMRKDTSYQEYVRTQNSGENAPAAPISIGMGGGGAISNPNQRQPSNVPAMPGSNANTNKTLNRNPGEDFAAYQGRLRQYNQHLAAGTSQTAPAPAPAQPAPPAQPASQFPLSPTAGSGPVSGMPTQPASAEETAGFSGQTPPAAPAAPKPVATGKPLAPTPAAPAGAASKSIVAGKNPAPAGPAPGPKAPIV